MACSLCDPSLGPVITEGQYWRLVLNHNQNLLGKCFLAMRRHVEEIHNIAEDEWLELHREITAATNALALAFDPDHFNYAFLQNQDRHVHLHVIPRYASARMFAGRQFEDPDYPDHYAVPAPTIILPSEPTVALADELRRWLAVAGSTEEDDQ